VAERAAYLTKIHQGLVAPVDEIARTIAAEVGMALTLASPIRAQLPASSCAPYSKLVTEYAFEGGRELGKWELEEFLEYKSLQLKPPKTA
jgi:acyl-CoA reductase-like NAD-dependent aldehyde dehydrogenase